ncbi:aspartic proteinase 39-like isoform X2 [Tripterygium wilfordii]|uniref:aspartic proteinase 39-like isoform X2 n=1 Tax=Tripterygium wilfordii TaxID=458696 RepID=UPI0018F811E8|nr:aspartic proteinase 39-like isoform X2 [Tripterygium wilfordii]
MAPILRSSFTFALSTVLILFFSVSSSTSSTTFAIASNNSSQGVFSVKYRYAGRERSLSTLKAHDSRRQLRILSGVDLPLGGSGRPDGVGLYYAKIGIGTPSKDYYVQVDTGSDLMWVNCIQCKGCPTSSSLGIELTLYNIKASSTGQLVSCESQFCYEVSGGRLPGCQPNITCPYLEIYGDGSSTAGYFVKDVVQYDKVSGDLQTTSSNGSVMFGCGYSQSGDLDSSNEDALDGILGFGKSNSSMISQLASTGKVKKMFAHCLDGTNGGGIFAIGHVVQPVVNMTPLVPNQPHYNVNVTTIQVGHDFLNLPKDLFEAGDRKGTLIDSGTTLAYLPEIVYGPLVDKPDLQVHTIHDDYTCFQYSGSVDDGFPNVTLHFENSVSLRVYPHDYLFYFKRKKKGKNPGHKVRHLRRGWEKARCMQLYPCIAKRLFLGIYKKKEGLWCIGWQNSGMQSKDRRNLTLLGDLVLSNKLVLYDLENQVIGWTEYNCSSSIKVRDEQTGTVHLVGSHTISSARNLIMRWTTILLLLLMYASMNSIY